MSQDHPAQNLLSRETSPYLLQHKDNPVHWMPWSQEALDRAKAENKPILLSVGYAACHWCHVMAHESFEDPNTAKVMNDHFINIKVDREERPDIDSIYQTALGLIGEHGGWPLTMFLASDGSPFWGGTYFPNEPKFGRPAFVDVLNHVSNTYKSDHEKISDSVQALKAALEKTTKTPADGQLTLDLVDETARSILRMIDPVYGGTTGAPKFPQASIFNFLWSAYKRSHSPLFRESVTVTLNHICQGGIYDHLGGGFSRYATDDAWLVPHFEKMLYDNAQLADLLASVWLETKDPLYQQRIEETIDWVMRPHDRGGLLNGDEDLSAFAAAYDADSEGEEGRYYIWSEKEIDDVLGDSSPFFKEMYDVHEMGNWEGKTILNRTAKLEMGIESLEGALKQSRDKLLAVRDGRIPPLRDDKILADWNGMMIAALARLSVLFERNDWLQAAIEAFDFICQKMADGALGPDRLFHAWCAGKARHPGTLDDYAHMARAALSLFEVTQHDRYLDQAMTWVGIIEDYFLDDVNGGYFLAARDTTDLITRPKTIHDSAVPSGNGIVADVLVRLYFLTGKEHYQTRAENLFKAFATKRSDILYSIPTLLGAFEFYQRAVQVVIVGVNDDDRDALFKAAYRASLAQKIIMVVEPDKTIHDNHPAFGKGMVDNKATAYICQGQTCGLPVNSPDALMQELKNNSSTPSG